MNLRELIFESDNLISKIENNENFITLFELSEVLEIPESRVLELFEDENLYIRKDEKISTELLKHLLLKEPEISSSPKSLGKLLLSSNNLLKLINKRKHLRLNILCRHFDMSVKNISVLFKKENIFIDLKPYTKIDCKLLKELVDKENNQKIIRPNRNLKELEEKIKSNEENTYTKSVVLNQFIRSEQIRQYAKLRANGICELCENPAPFIDKFGNPFLETHHIIYLSKGGTDTIDNVSAICPNCHRKIHNLNVKEDVKKLLSKRGK
jgi:predicted HNH restriction endonuclease